MSIQTFSKSFLFSNNKEKLKMKLPIATGPARGNQLAHGHTRPAQTERRGVRRPGRGFGPRPLGPARPRRRAMPASRRHGSAARPAGRRPLPAGSGQAGERLRFAWSWRMWAGSKAGRRRGGRGSSTAAEHGGAMADGGEARECATWAQQTAQSRAPSAGERGRAAGA